MQAGSIIIGACLAVLGGTNIALIVAASNTRQRENDLRKEISDMKGELGEEISELRNRIYTLEHPQG